VIGQFRRAAGGTDSRRGDGILDRHRQPVQRPGGLPARGLLVRAPGRLQGTLGVDRDDRVERRIDRLHTPQVFAKQFRGGDPPLPYRRT